MAKLNNTLSQERLKELLHYDSETGAFTWKVRASKNTHIGSIAGCTTLLNGKNYQVIRLDKILYQSHRLAWLYMTGSFPPNEIDHADGNGLNNKFSNLSAVNHLENHKNKKIHSNNTSGISGVYWGKDCKKWVAKIRVNYKYIHIGVFTTLLAAAYARHAAEIKYGFHKNHGTDRPL